MKRMCTALLLVVLMAGAAWASSSALDTLTSQNFATKLTGAVVPCKGWKVSPTRNDDAGAVQDIIFTLSPTVTAIATIKKSSGTVEQVIFMVIPSPHVADDSRMHDLMENMLNSVEAATRLVLPEFEQIEGLKAALHESVGPLNTNLYRNIGKKHTMSLNGIGVIISSMFTDKGAYVLQLGKE